MCIHTGMCIYALQKQDDQDLPSGVAPEVDGIRVITIRVHCDWGGTAFIQDIFVWLMPSYTLIVYKSSIKVTASPVVFIQF